MFAVLLFSLAVLCFGVYMYDAHQKKMEQLKRQTELMEAQIVLLREIKGNLDGIHDHTRDALDKLENVAVNIRDTYLYLLEMKHRG